jgi:predicted molibdopterin-dependent oxidoreductase YjgC
MSYDRLEQGGLQWPCPTPEHAGTPILHMYRFSRGKGLFHAVEYTPADEHPDDEYPFVLTTGRDYHHYHTGSMTRRSKGLDLLCPEGFVEMNPEDVRNLALSSDEMVRLSSRRGEIEIRLRESDRCPQGVLFVPFHFVESAVNRLTNPALDPVARIPELKVCAVAVDKI